MFAMLEPPAQYFHRTARVGQTVKFPCDTKLREAVDWVRVSLLRRVETAIYWGNFGPRDLGRNRRFTVMDRNHWYSLVISNVTVADSAYYRCDEDNGLGNQHYYLLIVQGTIQ